jgi:hypothetical protein
LPVSPDPYTEREWPAYNVNKFSSVRVIVTLGCYSQAPNKDLEFNVVFFSVRFCYLIKEIIQSMVA